MKSDPLHWHGLAHWIGKLKYGQPKTSIEADAIVRLLRSKRKEIWDLLVDERAEDETSETITDHILAILGVPPEEKKKS